jgi:hypothetical protein
MNDDDAPIPIFTIVPAQPNWFVAVFIPAGSEAGESWSARFVYDPIIAWEIGHDRYHASVRRAAHERCHHVEPITIDGRVTISNAWAIKRPDGKFELPADTTFDDEDDALKYLQQQSEQS